MIYSEAFPKELPTYKFEIAESCVFLAKLPPKVYDSPKILVHMDCLGLAHQQKADEGDKHLQ